LEERSYSKDINDHLGYLRQWTSSMQKGGFFSLWEHDELYNQAYLTASTLLNKNYDPEKGTVITYLKAFLWPRVFYAYGKYHGWRYRNSKWITLETSYASAFNLEEPSYVIPEKGELPPNLTDEEIDIILMRVGGMGYQEIANNLGYASGTTISSRIKTRIFDKFKKSGLLEENNGYRNYI